MRWTFDSNADAFYLYVREQVSERRIDLGEGQILDVGAECQVVGVEILGRRGKGDLELLERHGVPGPALLVLARITASQLPLVLSEGDLIDFGQVAAAVSRQRREALELAFAQTA